MPRNDDPVELVLAVHDETEKAWLVSLTGFVNDAVWIPKALSLRGDPMGGWEMMDARCQRKLVTIYDFLLPAFKAREKGLAA